MITYRQDRGQLKVLKTGTGFLKAEVIFATPCVLPYIEDGVQRYEAKLPEEVFRKETLESASGVPVCDGHPMISGQRVLVTPENYFQFLKGNLGDPKVDGYGAKGLLTIYDSTLIGEIQNKKKTQVSIGFTCEVENKSGMFNGVKYDAIQRNIIINHLAITDDARAGDATRILIDSKEGEKIMADEIKTDAGAGKAEVSKPAEAGQTTAVDNSGAGEVRSYVYKTADGSKDLKIDSKEIFDELIVLNKQLKEKEDAKKKEAEKVDPKKEEEAPDEEEDCSDKKSKGDEWKKEIDALSGKVDEINVAIKKLKDAMPDMVEAKKKKDTADEADKAIKADEKVKETIGLMRIVNRLMPELRTDTMTAGQIKLAVIQKGLPAAYRTDMTEDQINANYEAALEVLRIKANQFTGDTSVIMDSKSIEAEMAENKRKRLEVYGKSDKR